jgi:hypothetical protein
MSSFAESLFSSVIILLHLLLYPLMIPASKAFTMNRQTTFALKDLRGLLFLMWEPLYEEQ